MGVWTVRFSRLWLLLLSPTSGSLKDGRRRRPGGGWGEGVRGSALTLEERLSPRRNNVTHVETCHRLYGGAYTLASTIPLRRPSTIIPQNARGGRRRLRIKKVRLDRGDANTIACKGPIQPTFRAPPWEATNLTGGVHGTGQLIKASDPHVARADPCLKKKSVSASVIAPPPVYCGDARPTIPTVFTVHDYATANNSPTPLPPVPNVPCGSSCSPRASCSPGGTRDTR